jgi:hypothetical protein
VGLSDEIEQLSCGGYGTDGLGLRDEGDGRTLDTCTWQVIRDLQLRAHGKRRWTDVTAAGDGQGMDHEHAADH